MRHRRIVEDEAGCHRRDTANSHRFRSCLFLLTATVLLLTGMARADSQVRAVRISNISGTVQILSGSETEFQQAYPNMPLIEGSRLQSGDDGRAEIQFEDGSVARLTPNSELNFAHLRRDGSGATLNDIEVLSGLAYFETGKDRSEQYTIHFGNVQFTPAKGTIFRVNLDSSPAEMSVLHGSVHISGGPAVDVHDGQTVRFDANDDSQYLVADGVTGDSWDEWNSDRDEAMAAMSAQETREARLNGGGAGWSDLDYYGNWYSMPGYGNVWSPYGAGAGWDPYGSGYWGYYPGSGYQWISGYPWGWLPYRCGSWNFFGGGYGWGWSPGSCGGNSWGLGNYYGSGGIVIGNPPRGYRLPERPPRPHPVAPGANLPGRSPNLITVNRGADASRLEPRPVGINTPQRVVQIGGRPVTALPKSFNSAPSGPAGVVQPGAFRPSGSNGAANGHVPYVPVMRPYAGPVAPSAAPRGNVYSPRPAGSIPQPGNAGQFHPSGASPQYHPSASNAPSAPSAPPHMSSPPSAAPSHSGPAPSSGSHR